MLHRLRMLMLPFPWIWRGCWDWTAARTCWAIAFGVYRPPQRASRYAEHMQAIERERVAAILEAEAKEAKWRQQGG